MEMKCPQDAQDQVFSQKVWILFHITLATNITIRVSNNRLISAKRMPNSSQSTEYVLSLVWWAEYFQTYTARLHPGQDNGGCWQDLRRRIGSEVTPHYYCMCRRKFIRPLPSCFRSRKTRCRTTPPWRTTTPAAPRRTTLPWPPRRPTRAAVGPWQQSRDAPRNPQNSNKLQPQISG